MSAWYHRAGSSIFDDSDVVTSPHWQVSPDDRIGRPLRRRRGRMVKAAMLFTMAGGVGLAAWQREAVMPIAVEYGAMTYDAVGALITAHLKRPEPPPPAKSIETKPAEPEPPQLPDVAITERPEPAPAVVAATEPTAEPAPAARSDGPPPPPGSATPSHNAAALAPHQRRAEVAGLHPDLSRTLLDKLSEADWRNARQAIDKALAEVADDQTLVWPRPAPRGAAQYQIHFVEGAGEGCRRYVVTIAKDGWLTTALPVEKCGVKRIAAKRG